MPPEIDHLSYSSISSWLMCGANWKFHYLDKIKTLTSPELVFGSAFHGAVESFLSNPEIPLLHHWSTAWATQLESEGKEIDWGLETRESFYNNGLRILSNPDVINGILSIQPQIRPDNSPAIETKVELQVPGVPVPIIGYIDIITKDGVPGDFKTSARSWSADKANGEMQPLFYLAAMNQMGIPTGDWRFRHYVFVKTKTPQFQMYEHIHNPTQLMWLFKMIESVWKGIEAGVFPLNPGGWKCSPEYCEYYHLCRGKYGA